LRALIAAVAVCALSACYVYKIDIQQGNEITAQMLDKLQIGMRKTEVSELIGYPLVNDPFHEDRWDYYYYLKKGESGEVLQHSATLWFKEGALVKIDSALEKSGG
jgi:outer membrane protein assembly factor BamE